MSHPNFFDEGPRITLYDPLAEFLGAVEDGILQYGYFDAVRLAGHSCPTVASAYWAACKALSFLYPDAMPVRGDIRVEFRQGSTSGVTGVIANVVSMLTGATSETGFKGLAGQFDRRRLLFFAVDMPGEMRFTRLDTGRAVYVAANLQHVPGSPRVSELMANCLANTATPDEIAEFRRLWQERVRRILLEYGDDPQVFVVTPA
ncbi:MAG: FmdE family protein [Gallionella sp.]|nr:FmdE family protein [Gallionella sp.]